MASIVRLKPFATATAEERAKERYRRITLTTLASALARSISIGTALVSVPLAIGYLGTERYGLWLTISSVVAVLGFADLGMGNGLLNAIAEAHGRDDREAVRRYTSSAFVVLFGLALALGSGFGLIHSHISWGRVFNVASPRAVAEAGPAMAILAGLFILNLPLGLIQRVRMGYQEGFANSLWEGAGHLFGLGGVLLAIRLRAGLPWLVLAMAGAPAFALLLNGATLFGVQRPWLWPKIHHVTREAAGRVFRLGLLFFVLQTAGILAFSSDNIVAARILGPDAVAQYAVIARMFGVVPMILGMALNPLWPAYGEAIARGDVLWVRRTLVRSLTTSLLLAGAASALLVAFGAEIVHLWVGPGINPSFPLLLGLGTWTVLASVGGAVAMFLNGANVIRFQVLCALLVGVGGLLAKILLAHSLGLPGIVWGVVIAQIAFVTVPTGVYIAWRLGAVTWRPLHTPKRRPGR